MPCDLRLIPDPSLPSCGNLPSPAMVSTDCPSSTPVSLQTSDQSPNNDTSPSRPSWKRLIALAGLPCLISVAAIDPGNLEVDLQAGSLLGYRLIWALLLSSVVGWVLQTLSAHLTVRTGAHLAELCAKGYACEPVLSRAIFAFAEVSIIAFDFAEVVGTAIGLQLLFGWPLWLGMLMSAFDTMLVLYLQRIGLTEVELIIEGMLVILAACLFYEFALSKPAAGSMLHGMLVPSLGDRPRDAALLAIGILGSVIMSHNLFLHSWLIKQRQLAPGADEYVQSDTEAACRYASVESAAIFVATFIINAIVLSITAALPAHALAGVEEIGLKDAGALFSNVLDGRFASAAWGLALLASGHAATVTGTLSSQAVCEGFFDVRPGSSSAALVMATRAVAIVPAVLGALLAGESGADRLIVLSQVVLSLALPFAVIPLFKLFGLAQGASGDSRWLVRAGYVAFSVLILSNVLAIVDIAAQVREEAQGAIGPLVLLGGVVLASVVLIIKLVITPVQLEDYDLLVDRACSPAEKQKLLGERKLPLYT